MTENGYIKYNCKWIKSGPLSESEIKNLNRWRTRLYDLKLIGAYENGIGYGNLSLRIGDSNQFIITGSNTGQLAQLNNNHYTRVLTHDINNNKLTCEGPIKASSESLTHAAIYAAKPGVNGVIHVHSLSLWQKLIDKVPTTSREVEYGTPEMAAEMTRLLSEAPVDDKGIMVMGGHEEGIITFGTTVDEAGGMVLQHLND
jgi:L-ribulose-5-phosphate 4-epimerase